MRFPASMTLCILIELTNLAYMQSVWATEQPIQPFQNESESFTMGELTIENRLDRISIYGETDITKDQEGLAKARILRDVLNLTIKELEHNPSLPRHITPAKIEMVPNPFYNKKD